MSQVWDQIRIIEAIKNITHKTFDIDLSGKPDSMHIAEIGLDSMGVLDVIMTLEDAMGCKLKDIDLPKNPTLIDVANMVIKNLQTPSHA